MTALDSYVAAPDSSYHWSLAAILPGPGFSDYVINMTFRRGAARRK